MQTPSPRLQTPSPLMQTPSLQSCHLSCILGSQPHSFPVNRMTDTCKNITLPQTSFAGGKNIDILKHVMHGCIALFTMTCDNLIFSNSEHDGSHLCIASKEVQELSQGKFQVEKISSPSGSIPDRITSDVL